MKKWLSVVLTVCMVLMTFGILSVTADEIAEVPEGYIGVYTKEDLDHVRDDLSGKYILMNDIVFAVSDFAEDSHFYNYGCGWTPIGDYSTPFMGVFDGNGYEIEGLYMNHRFMGNDDGYVGLFGCVSGSGIVQNLGVVNGEASVSTERVGEENVENEEPGNVIEPEETYCKAYFGGIVAMVIQNAVIRNCYNGLNVTIKQGRLNEVISGGVVGYINANCTVTNCYNTGNVYAEKFAGGIAGRNAGYIQHCYNVGTVRGLAEAGGIVGKNLGTVQQCYNSGLILGANMVGGIAAANLRKISVAYNAGDILAQGDNIVKKCGGIAGQNYQNNAVIDNSYNCGNITMQHVTGSSYNPSKQTAGGITGHNYFGLLSNCYNVGTITLVPVSESETDNYVYKGGVAGRNRGDGNGCYFLDTVTYAVEDEMKEFAATQCTEEEMASQGTFKEFDFHMVWTMSGSEEYPYPELRAFFENETPDFSGDVNDDWKIDSTDARLVLQYFVGSVEEQELNLQNANVNGDTKVDSTDARLILQYFVGSITEFPEA